VVFAAEEGLILVIQGLLRVECEDSSEAAVVLAPGDLLILPPKT
jgi:uncharacterized RmlC-like cupin family protein